MSRDNPRKELLMSVALLRQTWPQAESAFLSKAIHFKPKIQFELDLKNFVIKTAATLKELESIVELRQHSFIEEFMELSEDNAFDFDEYDMLADHVILWSKKHNQVVGAYRILNSDFSDKLYSSEQYDISQFLAHSGTKIELGRACIHKDHRNGLTLSLVWKGLAHYASLAQGRFMCGCASVKTLSQRVAESIYWYLYPSHFNNQFNITVLPKYQHPNPFDSKELLPWEFVQEAIPPLLKTYIKAGANICSAPAYDRVYKCVDFFTVLDLTLMNAQYQEKYFGG